MSDREYILEHLYVIFYDNTQGLGLCGCGNPEAAYDLVRDLLGLAPFYENSRWKTAESLTGNIPGAHHIVLGVMDRAGLIEHGSSQNGAWLTGKGTWCLAAMRTAEFDDIDQQGYPHDGEACTDDCWRAPIEEPTQLARVVETCCACPSQWDAWTVKGQYLYLRYRHGIGSVEAQPSNDSDTWNLDKPPLVEWDDDTGNGDIELGEFLEKAGLQLAPGAEVIARS